jgi:hypothetical protein
MPPIARGDHTGLDDEDEDAPTLAPGDDDDDGPTLSPHDRDMEDEDGPTMSRGAAVRAAQAQSSAITTPKKPRAPGPAALAAHTPTPAVSELRRPARSRRTPAEGVPQHQPSVLQAIVGAAGSEPMPQQPRSAVSNGVPHDPMRQTGSNRHPTAPPPVPAGAPPSPLQATQPMQPPYGNPQGGYPQAGGNPGGFHPAIAPGQIPGQHQLPQHLQPGMQPGMQQGYPQWPQAPQPQPPQPQPPHGSPPPPFSQLQPQFGGYQQPYQQSYPQMGPTFTQQMRAMMEVDEIPSHFKVQSSGPRWFVLAIAALVAVTGAAIATYFILRRDAEPRPTASIAINTVPEGATVFVDSQQLPDKTPAVFEDSAPGKRHLIVVTLPRHRPVEKTVEVSAEGGEQRVLIPLQKINGKILITSIPEGADIFIKGDNRGRTPANLVDIEIETTRELELRHKDFGMRTIPLTWPDNGEITLQIDLKK